MLFRSAFPAGLVIWLISNLTVGDVSLADYFINWTNPFALFIGLNGIILLAYVVAIPANEIVIPTILMLTVVHFGLTGVGAGAGVMFDTSSIDATKQLLEVGGWTVLTGVNLMIFTLLHNPCSTTLFTIYKETGSLKWTVFSAIYPIIMGFTLCFLVAQVWRIF